MTRPLLTTLALAAMLALAACSSGQSGGNTTAPSQPAASTEASGDATGAGGCSPSTETGTVQATMSGQAFSPATVTAAVGDVITWTNEDSVPHTATLTDDSACTTDNLGQGESGSLTFKEAGTYAFFCRVHPDMQGTIEISG